jgi:hypothetical protein
MLDTTPITIANSTAGQVQNQIERHPEGLHEDFIVPAAAVLVATWPCGAK